MNRTSLRRLAAVAVAPVAALGLAVAPAQATPEDAVETAGEWIAGQLADQPIQQNFGFPDFGLTIDAFLALDALDAQPTVRDSTIAALDAQASGYVDGGDPADPDQRYAGAIGKLGFAAQLAGEDPTDFAGFDLVAEAEERVQDTGRATDLGGDFDGDGAPDDFSNGVGQAWVVRLLTATGSDLADEAAGYLLAQQCDDGSFLVALDDAGCTSGTGDVDATIFALDALLDVRDAELLDVTAAIDEGVDFLLETQDEDGTFENADGAVNTNTTGKAGALFGRVGGLELEAARAVEFVRFLQVDEFAEDTELEDELGAIAFDEDAFDEALDAGLDANLDQWRRATYQAATALPFAAPAAEFTVTAPDEVEAGETFEVDIEGPAAGENGILLLIPADVLEGFEDELAEESPEALLDDPQVAASARFTGEGPGRITTRADLDPTTVQGQAEAPEEAGDYVLLAISEFSDRGGFTEVAVTSADGGGNGGGGAGDGGDTGSGAPVGSGSGTVGASDPLPAAGSTTTPWLPWAALATILAGAALVVGGRGRTERA